MRKLLSLVALGLCLSTTAFSQDYSNTDPRFSESYNLMGEKNKTTIKVIEADNPEYYDVNESMEVPILSKLDVDGDHYLSVTEFLNFQTFSADAFVALDKNKDARLNREEYKNIVNLRLYEDGSLAK